jgi:hypothetical protein
MATFISRKKERKRCGVTERTSDRAVKFLKDAVARFTHHMAQAEPRLKGCVRLFGASASLQREIFPSIF